MGRVDLDKWLEKQSKTQKYLGLRIISIILLVVFAVDTTYKVPKIAAEVFFSSLILLVAPLFLEYFLGMNTYSNWTSVIRIIGAITSGFGTIVCVIGLMGKVEIAYSSDKYINSMMLFGKIPVYGIMKSIPYILVGIAIFDYVFTFNRREAYYYSMITQVEQCMEENYDTLKSQGTLEARKERVKQELEIIIKGGGVSG